jgi:hypothetical protein
MGARRRMTTINTAYMPLSNREEACMNKSLVFVSEIDKDAIREIARTTQLIIKLKRHSNGNIEVVPACGKEIFLIKVQRTVRELSERE